MNKIKNSFKLIIVIIIVACFIWFLLLKPSYTFKKYENNFLNAAKEYYEMNSSLLPTGNRMSTVSLKTLYNDAFLKEDMYIPYTTTACSVTDSWVKVKKVNGEYKYTVYLKCGVMESSTDHEGPTIKLNGDDVTVERYSEYKEKGVKSVIDKSEGTLDTKDVKISSDVDTSNVGEYEVTYTAQDSLLNKTTVTRKVKVVETLKTTIKKALNGEKYYKGINSNNYIKLSNMLFRIITLDDNKNIVAIAEEDVANINYNKIDKWLDNVYLKSFTKEAKKYLVKSKYCANEASEGSTTTQCESYTDSKYAYIISQNEINNTLDQNNKTFLKPNTMSWVVSNSNNLLVTRSYFYGDYNGKNFYPATKNDNYGIRPVITIKGTSLLKSGNGTYDNPYSFNETKEATNGDALNTRYTGEYVKYSGYVWRIIETEKDGTTKAIMYSTLKDSNGTKYRVNYLDERIYNPKLKGNIGNKINNVATKYLDTSYLDSHEINVPIYEKSIIYGKEIKNKKYKVQVAAPNFYEMFSAMDIKDEVNNSYWLLNSSKDSETAAVIGENGSVINENISYATDFGIRPVVFFNKNITITNGGGTYKNPYFIKK